MWHCGHGHLSIKMFGIKESASPNHDCQETIFAGRCQSDIGGREESQKHEQEHKLD
jgi:hypothetical protein